MLISELIVRHVGPHGALHARGIRLNQTQVPPGIITHLDGNDAVAPVAGDLLLISAPVGPGLREHVDTDLPVGATMVLLLEAEVTELPVGRVLAALTAAKLQVLEAAAVSGTSTATVAVVATRTDELIAPQPYLALNLEPGDHGSPAHLRRVLGEHTLEGLVQRARERALEARLGEVAVELEELRAYRQHHEAIVLEYEAMVDELELARKELATERKRSMTILSSTSFKLASRLARGSSVVRRVIRRPGSSKSRG